MANIFYINNKGQRVDFDGISYIFVGVGSMLSYEWEYTANDYKNVIDSFASSMVAKDFQIAVKGKTKQEYHDLIKYMENVIDSDLYNKTQGKIYFGEWYLPCYVVGCSDETYDSERRIGTRTYSIVSEDGQWIKATRYRNGLATDILKYPYDFTVDKLQNKYPHVSVSNGTPRGAEYKILLEEIANSKADYATIYIESVENPDFESGLLKYECSLGEYVEIDTYNKTIYYCDKDGNRQNYFMYRDRDKDDIFTKLLQGVNTIRAEATKIVQGEQELSKPLGIEIVVYEKKSNPEWWT